MYIVLNFKSWVFSRVCGHIQQHFYCAETAVYELAVKLLTLSFDSPPPISLQSAKFRRYGNVFRWFFFAFYMLMYAIRYVTFWPWTVVTHGGSRVQPCHQVWRPYAYDVDLPHCTSKVEHIVAFTAIFSNICTAHAQKRLFMNFRCKFRHRRSIARSRFPIRVQTFGDLATFSVDFYILYAECPPYFYFRFV